MSANTPTPQAGLDPGVHLRSPLRVLVIGEQDLSHGAFVRRFAAALGNRPGVVSELNLIDEPQGLERLLVAHVPFLGALDFQTLRWRLRYSLRTRHLLRQRATDVADVALVNTQACALLSRRVMRKVPTVLSVDATARQFAALEYWRPRGRTAVAGEAPLDALERRAYADAAGVLAWSDWTACSLRDDYGVPPERLAVVHPGLDVADWSSIRVARPTNGPLRLLFVGNTVWRKGLRTLLDALPGVGAGTHLDIVTNDAIVPHPGVVVHRGLQPNSYELRALYAGADVFVFPTRADALPWTVLEAMAAGLPVVASSVGAIPEMVGDCGRIVPPGDVPALREALRDLVDAPTLLTSLGDRARRRAEEHYDQKNQVPKIVEMLRAASVRGHVSPRPVAGASEPGH